MRPRVREIGGRGQRSLDNTSATWTMLVDMALTPFATTTTTTTERPD